MSRVIDMAEVLDEIEQLAAYLAADFNDRSGMDIPIELEGDYDDREIAEAILDRTAVIKKHYKL